MDSGSTTHMFFNGNLLSNTRKPVLGEYITINTNAGSVATCPEGTLPGFGTAWHNPDGMADVLSMSQLSLEMRLAMDASIDNAINAHKTDGATRHFRLTHSGLHSTNVTDHSGSVLTTANVSDQEIKCSSLDTRRAKVACKLQNTIGHPTTRDLIKIMESNPLEGCGTTRKDTMIAEAICGPSVAGLKGKTTTSTAKHVREEITPIPDFVVDDCMVVTPCVDIMHVNTTPLW